MRSITPAHYLTALSTTEVKKRNALKYQAAVLLTSMFGYLFGLIEGRHNDGSLGERCKSDLSNVQCHSAFSFCGQFFKPAEASGDEVFIIAK